MATLLLFTILSLLSLTGAEDRAHGLVNESPMISTSPEANAFFKQPNNKNRHCDSSDCSSLPVTSTVMQSTVSTLAHETTASTGGNLLGASGIAGIPFAFVFVCLVAMGNY